MPDPVDNNQPTQTPAPPADAALADQQAAGNALLASVQEPTPTVVQTPTAEPQPPPSSEPPAQAPSLPGQPATQQPATPSQNQTPASPGLDPSQLAATVAKAVKESLAPEPAQPAAQAPTWQPPSVDEKFVDALVEDPKQGAIMLNQLVQNTIKSTLELVIPFVQTAVEPLRQAQNFADAERARQEFAKQYSDLSAPGDLQWAEEVARQVLQSGQKFQSNKEFFDIVATRTRALKEEYRKRLGIAATPAPAAPAPVPGAPSSTASRGKVSALNDEQKEMLRLQGLDPDRV